MDTENTLNYRLYVQRQEDFIRTDYHTEFKHYMTIRNGDVELVKQHIKEVRKDFNKGKGSLSDDPLRNVIYHLVVSAAIVSRICVDGGLDQETAYTLSDVYIRKADQCRKPEEALNLLEEMQLDYAVRMKNLKKVNVISIHIRRSIDYIYDNLQNNLTVAFLAERENLSPGYFSRLFMKETGMGLKDFIKEAKIRTAQNMLKYSTFSILEISTSLGFSSQSAFTSVFKELTGMTPKKYRDSFYSVNM